MAAIEEFARSLTPGAQSELREWVSTKKSKYVRDIKTQKLSLENAILFLLAEEKAWHLPILLEVLRSEEWDEEKIAQTVKALGHDRKLDFDPLYLVVERR